ncbi:ornithine cyclodeaminase family protein [Deinococcus sp.]|uniref:ornithine cyclodeaminase family protein n=1 Tax=Deinococcus sp. TaxID=47478 RepID=UPI003B5CDAC0
MTHTPMSLMVLNDATIRSLLNYPHVLQCIEEAFAADALGRATTLPVIGHSLHGGRYSIKASHLQKKPGEAGPEVFGLKLGSYFPGNAAHGLSTHHAAMLLGDPLTGRPTALLAANVITEFRTAAAGAVAARHLARADAGVVALFGTGTQAYAQIQALRAVRPVREVRVWSRAPVQAAAFAQQLCGAGLSAQVMLDGQAACAGADIVVTVTPSRQPIVQQHWIAPGTHVNAMGSDAPGKQELDPALVMSARLIVDRAEQSQTIGELQRPVALGLTLPNAIYTTLGELCAQLKPGRTSKDEVTVFDSTGVSFQDTSLAGLVLQLAEEEGLGQHVEL